MKITHTTRPRLIGQSRPDPSLIGFTFYQLFYFPFSFQSKKKSANLKPTTRGHAQTGQRRVFRRKQDVLHFTHRRRPLGWKMSTVSNTRHPPIRFRPIIPKNILSWLFSQRPKLSSRLIFRHLRHQTERCLYVCSSMFHHASDDRGDVLPVWIGKTNNERICRCVPNGNGRHVKGAL